METPYAPFGNLVASAEVNAAGAIQGNSFGVTGAPVLGSSIYTYTLSNQIDPVNSYVHITPMGGTAAYGSGGVTADNTLVVAMFNDAGAATNGAHQVHVFRRATR